MPMRNEIDPKDTTALIEAACENFLQEWDRGEWMADHGEWADVESDESYIAEGVIDPDDVATRATDCDVSRSWQGWDCREGWGAYRVGRALYLRWWRNACGNRRDRDLWVLVDSEFFQEDSAS